MDERKDGRTDEYEDKWMSMRVERQMSMYEDK